MIFKHRIHGILSFTVLLMSFISCSDGLKIEQVNSTSINNNPLLVSVSFNTEVATEAFIEYWLTGEETRSTSATFSNKMSHQILLLGLTSDSDYSYQIHLKNGKLAATSELHSFTTGSLPEHLPEFDLVLANENVFDGFIMLRKMDDPGTQMIVNNRGEIIWYQVSDSVIFRPFSITSNGAYLALKGTDEIIEMNIYGDTILYLLPNGKGFDKKLHHEIFRDKKHQIVALTKEEKLFDLTEFGGSNNEVVVGDGIMIIDSLGNSIWKWNIFDVVEVYPSLDLFKFRKDWSHANALSKDLDGNFLISFRNFNQIWKVDAVDGHIIWKLGENGDFQLNENEYFKYQHAVHVNPSGDIMLFDNISNVDKRRWSSAIAFKIDDANKLAETTLVVNLPDSLYSFKQGSVYLIDANKLLFCSSMSKKIAITNLEGVILWQVNSDQSFYRAVYISDKGYFQK